MHLKKTKKWKKDKNMRKKTQEIIEEGEVMRAYQIKRKNY